MPSRSKPATGSAKSPAKKRPVKPFRSSSKSSPSDAISLLKEDHVRVKQMLTRLDATTNRAVAEREKLLGQIESEVKVHTQIEEEIFYPAFKEAARSSDQHIYYEAVEEHQLVDIVLPQAKGTDTGSEEFAAKAKVLKDLIEHHAEEEETEMFVKARKVMSATQLRELGERMDTRKQQLQAGLLTRVAQTAGRTLGKVLNRKRSHKDDGE
jgi:hemerythrin-like domain-containing protein